MPPIGVPLRGACHAHIRSGWGIGEICKNFPQEANRAERLWARGAPKVDALGPPSKALEGGRAFNPGPSDGYDETEPGK